MIFPHSQNFPRAEGIGGEAPTCHQLQIALIALSVILGFVLIGGLWLILHVAAKAHQAVMDAENARIPARYRRPPYVAFYGNLGGTATTGGVTHGNGNRSNVNGHTVLPPRGRPPPPWIEDETSSPPSSDDEKPDRPTGEQQFPANANNPTPPNPPPDTPPWLLEVVDWLNYYVNLPDPPVHGEHQAAMFQHAQGFINAAEQAGITHRAAYIGRHRRYMPR